MLEADEKYYLPRIFCYFDDTIGTSVELYNDFIGQRLSINEFNEKHEDIKLGIPYYLLSQPIQQTWYHQIWIGHLFKHSKYGQFVADTNQQLPI
jgi:glutaredoxin-related protein